MVLDSALVAVTKTSDFAASLNKEFLHIQAPIECGFTLKRVCHVRKTYSEMHLRDKYSQLGSMIIPVSLNG